ncbi:MAG: sigma-70 family RNA polymerase sigma factor [Chloroflexaceae bacterium]|nr:sigma-70 family RNA polymerase sigma factor [Chloroflexaceae bacterium]
MNHTNPVDHTDERLLERLGQGDHAAFEALFLRYYQRVYRVLVHLVGCREQAEDLAQETFLALYHQPPRPDTGSRLAAWLCRVALNRGYNALRRERRARQRMERMERMEQPAQLPSAEEPASEVVRAEERAMVRATLAHLPERQSAILLLRSAGCSYAEIATALHIKPGSVGTLLARAERAFLAIYQQQTGGVSLEEERKVNVHDTESVRSTSSR